MKTLSFIETNGYNMVALSDGENPIKYITETEDFPKFEDLEYHGRLSYALCFLHKIRQNDDYSTWEESDKTDLNEFVGEAEILVQIDFVR